MSALVSKTRPAASANPLRTSSLAGPLFPLPQQLRPTSALRTRTPALPARFPAGPRPLPAATLLLICSGFGRFEGHFTSALTRLQRRRALEDSDPLPSGEALAAPLRPITGFYFTLQATRGSVMEEAKGGLFAICASRAHSSAGSVRSLLPSGTFHHGAVTVTAQRRRGVNFSYSREGFYSISAASSWETSAGINNAARAAGAAPSQPPPKQLQMLTAARGRICGSANVHLVV